MGRRGVQVKLVKMIMIVMMVVVIGTDVGVRVEVVCGTIHPWRKGVEKEGSIFESLR